MSAKEDWVAQTHEGRYLQATITVNYLTAANLARMGLAGNAALWITNVLIVKYNVFKTAFLAWKNPAERTMIRTAAMQDAEMAFVSEYRRLYMGYLKNNPLVTSENLVEMGMPQHSSGSKKAASTPTKQVSATVDTSIPGIVEIHFREKNARGKAKPKGMTGVEIIWDVRDTLPEEYAELHHSEFSTRSPKQIVPDS
ncbi:MAG: hypothetical protein LBJ47_03475, partial [Tannerella sp.]|nr:hypothetical protein [Tannerella sp.]